MKTKINLEQTNALVKYKFNLKQTDLNIRFIEPGKFCNCYAEFDDEVIEYKNNNFNEIVSNTNKKNNIFKQIKIGNLNIQISNNSNCVYKENSVVIKENEKRILNLYLNQEQLYSLIINTMCSDVAIEGIDHIASLEIETMRGDITMKNCGKNKRQKNFKLDTLSGDVKLDRCHYIDSINTASGNISLLNCNLEKTKVKTTSGDVCIKKCSIEDSMHINTVSGDIDLHLSKMDFNKVITKTCSGDIFRSVR